MSLKAKVVNQFRDKDHDNRIYQPGDTYPAEGYSADEERVRYLSEIHPEYNKIYLADVEEIESAQDSGDVQKEDESEVVKEVAEEKSEFPKHVGGGTYELSNGEKVKGKDEALEAEKALKE
ncbi:hypothetical protein [Paenibacillus sp. 7516]|uniref:hypothetical protein n=1 Tax=Paenibacillus sp. 7516 TaxID=2022549 RepID=UPI000BA77A18|nr:hypothetical protein [Paenibacillus sp. 7516]PAF31864.1 hypothetical protein CHI14_09430 [Paenibacillus sp. 7516]